MTIGQRIRKVRMDRGIKQKDLAAAARVTQPQLSDWERDRYPPERENLRKIAAALKLPIDYFVEDATGVTHTDPPGVVQDAPSAEQEGGEAHVLPHAATARILELEAACASTRDLLERMLSSARTAARDIQRALARLEGKTTAEREASARSVRRGPSR